MTTLFPRHLLIRPVQVTALLAAGVAIAEAVFVEQDTAPLIAVAVLIACGPPLLRGARTGSLHVGSAWAIASVLTLIPALVTVGEDPARGDYLSTGWYACAVLAAASLLRMAGRVGSAAFLGGGLLVETLIWAGPVGVLRLGVATEVVIFSTILMLHRALIRIAAQANRAAEAARDHAARQLAQDAFHLERQVRLERAGRDAAPTLQRIVDLAGDLDPDARQACRILEQTIRDEIRGRHLLNDRVRAAVLAHRRRGARVLLLDDGGLDALAPDRRNHLLDELAGRLAPLRSSRIVVRTAPAGPIPTLTLTATTPDEVAAALGLDDDPELELSVVLEAPAAAS